MATTRRRLVEVEAQEVEISGRVAQSAAPRGTVRRMVESPTVPVLPSQEVDLREISLAHQVSSIGEAIPDDPNLDSTDGAHPAWWRSHEHFAAVFKQHFGVDYNEGRRIWEMFHQPGVLACLRFALSTYRNPPTAKMEGTEAFEEMREAIRTEMLSSVDDISEAVGEELLGADEIEEIVVTEEDIPELIEKIDESKDSALKVLKTHISDLRNKLTDSIDELKGNFKDCEVVVELNDDVRPLDYLSVTREADQVVLYLRKHFGEL